MWACDPAITTEIVNTYQVAGPLFVQALQSFFAAQCALVGDHLWPADATEAVLEDPNYDFIIIGAGSAGAVVANRLSEIPHWKVLLVEAGGNPNLATEIPQLFYNAINSSVDWGYKTQPQNSACRGYKGHQCAWPRGKTLGGCSSINGMFYVRGNKLDYNEWAAYGNKGWSYEEILYYFKKSENFSNTFNAETKKFHNNDGYLYVGKNGPTHTFEDMIIKGVKELGVKELDDVNGSEQMGITRAYTNIKDGVRHSTARAFLSNVKDRKNLHIIKGAYVTKLLFYPKSTKVSGILFEKHGKNIKVNARKEVILSAGAINTPQLLLLSGIGPRNHLKSLNIEVRSDLPVGENLQDHVFFPVYYSAPAQKNFNTISDITKTFTDYMFTKTGKFSDISPHRIIAFVNSSDTIAVSPEVQFHYLVFPPRLSNLVDVYTKHGLKDEINSKYKKLNENNFVIIIYNTLLKPKSKGRILLKSTNPHDHPLIIANYFKDPDDLHILIKNTKKFSLALNNTKSFKDAGFKLAWLDLDGCEKFKQTSDEFLECVARELTFSLYHPTSTAKMGPDDDETAVVNPELKVRKVEGLRIVDASIMPFIVRGNTNAPTIMIGEKGASLIKKFWLEKHTEL